MTAWFVTVESPMRNRVGGGGSAPGAWPMARRTRVETRIGRRSKAKVTTTAATSTASVPAYASSGGWVAAARSLVWGRHAARVERHLASVGLPTHLQDIAGFAQEGLSDADALMALMAQDKKVKRGRLTFILLQAVGRAVVANDVEPALVRDFLQQKLSG